LTAQLCLGESSEIDLSGYATIASTMLRIGSKLGVRKQKPEPSADEYLDSLSPEPEDSIDEDSAA